MSMSKICQRQLDVRHGTSAITTEAALSASAAALSAAAAVAKNASYPRCAAAVA